MVIPTESIRKTGKELSVLAGQLQKLADRANVIDNSIAKCYMQGGIGHRVITTAAHIRNTANQLSSKSKALNKASLIYEREELELAARSKNITNTIRSGYNPLWTSSPVIQAIVGSKSVGIASFLTILLAGLTGIVPGKITTISSPDITITGGKPRSIDLKNKKIIIKTTKPSTTQVEAGTIRFVTAYSKDSRYDSSFWGGDDSKVGCAAACTAMALSCIGIDKSPKQMKEEGYARNDFFMKNWKIDGTKSECQGRLKNNTPEKNEEIIDKALMKHLENPTKVAPPIVAININGNDDELNNHYVIILGKNEDGTYRVADPGSFSNFASLKVTEGPVSRDNKNNVRGSYIKEIRQYSIP